MVRKSTQLIALISSAFALAPALAHLLVLPNKIDLARDEYFVVQQIYRGWALLGIVVFTAILSNLLLAVVVRKLRSAMICALIALACLLGTQAIFWTWTHPANAQTADWTEKPENWATLRTQWEYSHAASALLNFAAFASVSLSVITASNCRPS